MTNNDLSALPGPFAAASADRARLDHAKYAPMIEGFDISEAQGREFLETLWSIMCAMVEIGFTVDVCAQLFQTPQIGSDAARGDVELKQTNDGEVIEQDQEDESA